MMLDKVLYPVNATVGIFQRCHSLTCHISADIFVVLTQTCGPFLIEMPDHGTATFFTSILRPIDLVTTVLAFRPSRSRLADIMEECRKCEILVLGSDPLDSLHYG